MRALPVIDSKDAWLRFRGDVSAWSDHVAAVARAHGVPDSPISDLGGSAVVAAVGDAHVLKLIHAKYTGEIAAEAEMLRVAEGRLPVPIPAFVATGLHEGWPYLLARRLAGRTFGASRAALSEAAKVALVHEIGRALAALHAVPLAEMGPAVPRGWAEFVAEQSAACTARQAAWGVPEVVLADVQECLSEARLDDAAKIVPLHADVTDENVLVDEEGRLSGVIDFGDARAGDPLYDLVTPALLVARGQRTLLHALLEGYGIAPERRDALFFARLTAYAVLHPWNDLTRYTPWAQPAARSLEELGRVMFPR